MKIDYLSLPVALLLPLSMVAQDRANVILILVDDLGKEWIPEYGAENIILPNIQALARESIIFDRAYSMPQSTPSRVSLLTSRYPYNNGWINHYDVPRWGYGAQYDYNSNPCFVKQLKESGYRCCVAGKWQLNDFRLQPEAMTEMGFDEYLMWTGAEKGNEAISQMRYWDPYIHSKSGSRTYKGEFGPDLFTKFITDFIDKNHDEPLFVYYPMALTHTPLVCTPHCLEAKSDFEKHCAMVEYMDILIGRIVESLKDNGIYDNTYIILTTDNGTTNRCVGLRAGEAIRGGKTLLSENGINAPFIVKPLESMGASRTDALIDFSDIGATILDITCSASSDFEIDGVSFLPVLKGAKRSSKGYALSMGGLPAAIDESGHIANRSEFRERAIMGDSYKVILSDRCEIEQVYDLKSDPFERFNLSGDTMVMAVVDRELGSVIRELPPLDNAPQYEVVPHDKQYNEDLSRFEAAQTKSGFAPTVPRREYDDFVNDVK